MIKLNSQVIKTLALSQALVLSLSAPFALAATSKVSPEIVKLDNIETVIYGAPKTSESTDSRLKSLEVKLFGVSRKGTTTERLSGIEKTLSYGSGAATGSLLPPLAPTLDTSSSSAAEVPPAYIDAAERAASSNGSSNGSFNSSGNYSVDSSGALAEAMQLYQEGKIPEAESAFHGIVSKDPSNGDAYYNLAVIAEGKGDFNGALSYYRSALNLNPQDTDLQSAVASVQNKLRPANSMPSAPVAVAQGPQDAARKQQLKNAVASASTDYKAGRYDSAVSKLNNVASQVPDDADVQFALAQAFRAKGDLNNARSHMARASALNPASTTFGGALNDIDRAIASKGTASSGSSGSFPQSSPGPSPADTFASSNSNSALASQPEGQITPFAGSKAGNLNSGGGSLNGVAYSARSQSSRLKKAATYGLAGAAAGALSGALFNSGGSRMGSAKNSALRGAVLGAVFGFATGR